MMVEENKETALKSNERLESLFASSCLWAFGFCTAQQYNALLDRLFLEMPTEDILLELEGLANQPKNACFRLKRFFESEADRLDADQFGQTLFAGLERAYRAKLYSLGEYCERAYQMWDLLPESVRSKQPFWTLSYADEPLSWPWGDEKQTRDLLETAFGFYKK